MSEKLKSSLKNWKTTVLGLVPTVIGLLGLLGVIDTSNAPEAVEGVNTAVEGAFNIADHIIDFIALFGGLGLIFSKDGDK